MTKCYTLLLGLLFAWNTAYGQSQPRLIINEFLADNPTGLTGDANGDGVRSSSQDEFVELANTTSDSLDLTGWMVGDDEAINFTFPASYKLAPRGIVVIFGGGDVTNVQGYNADPLLTRVFSADSTVGNGFANVGDFIIVKSPDGNEDMYLGYNSLANTGGPTTPAVEGMTFEHAVEVTVPADQDVAVTRSPDGSLAENPWVQHSAVNTALFSPGVTVGGSATIPKQLPPLTVIINEVLADPSTDVALGDANRDGVRSSSGDEFVELANVSDAPVDLSGWTVGDDEAFVTFTFPQGYTLGPREIVTIFGGGDVSNVPGYSADPLVTRAFVADSLHLGVGNGFANGGDIILLLSDDGTYDTYLAYGSLSNTGGPAEGKYPAGTDFEIEIDIAAPADGDNSVTRYPDGNVNVIDPFVQHLSVSTNPFSPSTTIDGASRLPAPKPPITVVINEILANAAGDANGDGTTNAMQDQFIELVNVSETNAVDLSGWQVGDEGGLSFTFPQGYVLSPRAFVAVFGGGDVSGVPGYSADQMQTRVFAASGMLGNGLDAAGDYAVLVSPDGAYDSYVAFGSKQGAGAPSVTGTTDVEWEFNLATAAPLDQPSSITRDPDGNFLSPDPFVVHSSVSELPYSPAQTTKGLDDLDDFVDVPHPWGTGYVLDYNWWERDRVEIREAPSLMPLRMDQGTIEMWFKPDSLLTNTTHPPDWTYLFTKNLSGNVEGDLGIGWERGEGRLQFFIQDGTTTSTVFSSDKIDEIFYPRWYHIAATWNTADSMRLFIDGKQVGATKSELPLYGGTQQMAIGGGNADLWNNRFESFRGMIDEVRFSVVSRYTEDFELPTAPFEPDQFTLALWHLDEGSGDVTQDVTGNGFTGYLGGFDADGNPDPASAPAWVDASTLVGTAAPSERTNQFTLGQNFPNPFKTVTTLRYSVAAASDVQIHVYNVLGQRVATLVDGMVPAGAHTVRFDGTHLASGIYFCTLRAADSHVVRKMMLIK